MVYVMFVHLSFISIQAKWNTKLGPFLYFNNHSALEKSNWQFLGILVVSINTIFVSYKTQKMSQLWPVYCFPTLCLPLLTWRGVLNAV